MSENLNEFVTTDLYVAAILMSKKFTLLRTNTHKGSKKVLEFVFQNGGELQNTFFSYINGSLEGNLKDFRNSIETIKDLIHAKT